jgi:hypothetical protein
MNDAMGGMCSTHGTRKVCTGVLAEKPEMAACVGPGLNGRAMRVRGCPHDGHPPSKGRLASQ